MSPLQLERLKYQPPLPEILNDIISLKAVEGETLKKSEALLKTFPNTSEHPVLTFQKANAIVHEPLVVGVVFSGGQAAGGHNVISGLFDGLKKLNPDSRLIGFLNGPNGIIENKKIEITEERLAPYRNQGGFDLIGSGRTKIETPEQFKAAEKAVVDNSLDGLVIIGGDDSNTNAAFLSEYFIAHGIKTNVVGVPKTIDGDLKNEWIEISFGFDTACKIYSEIIGNIIRDALSAKKYYYFIKLMGRSASHITLECALQTHPNMTIIGEEVEAEGKTLQQITSEICDMICERAVNGKNYGVILLPEGIIEFIPEFKRLISELNRILAKTESEKIETLLSPEGRRCLQALPKEIQSQLLLDRDPHGNVQVSKIETERLFIETVKAELKNRKNNGTYIEKFSAQPIFCGYEGRSGLPSNFDCQYCYALGHVAALLIDRKATGYMCCVNNLTAPVEEWVIQGIPLIPMMHIEERQGKEKPVIRKALVDLEGTPFLYYKDMCSEWRINDEVCTPGPIQFFGPQELTDAITYTLQLESQK
jgi:pyrophosphate--fructose-6-phosphate 1-phosphotransferase